LRRQTSLILMDTSLTQHNLEIKFLSWIESYLKLVLVNRATIIIEMKYHNWISSF
jgi:hypothetical protein